MASRPDLKRRQREFIRRGARELRAGGGEFVRAVESQVRGEGVETDLVIDALAALGVSQLDELVRLLNGQTDRALQALRRAARAELSFRNGERSRPLHFELPALTETELLAAGFGAIAAAEGLRNPAGRLLFASLAQVCNERYLALKCQHAGAPN